MFLWDLPLGANFYFSKSTPNMLLIHNLDAKKQIGARDKEELFEL
jgi:hypothetical protein